jgi:hypothetical protein
MYDVHPYPLGCGQALAGSAVFSRKSRTKHGKTFRIIVNMAISFDWLLVEPDEIQKAIERSNRCAVLISEVAG